MNRTMSALLAICAVLSAAACKGNNERTAADTTTVRAADTVAGRAVPTTDTVVKTTTTTTDTIQGKVNKDSVKDKVDSVKARKDSIAAAKKHRIDSIADAKKAAAEKKKPYGVPRVRSRQPSRAALSLPDSAARPLWCQCTVANITESERIEPLARTRFVGDLHAARVPLVRRARPHARPLALVRYPNVDPSPMTGLRLHDRRASLLFCSTALLASFALSACAKKQGPPPRQIATVAVAQARRANVPYVIEANGVVSPMQSVAVTPQVDGIIVSVDFQEGQEVRQGQPLFHVDPRPYENAYEQALAVLARDSATWVNAKSNADR